MTSTATPFTFPRLPRDVRRIQTADREVLVTRQPENDLNDVLAEVSA